MCVLGNGCGNSDTQTSGVDVQDIQETQNTVVENDSKQDDTIKESREIVEKALAEMGSIYTVSIDGISYLMPATVGDFIANGWKLGKDYENIVVNETGIDSLFVHKDVDGQIIQLNLGVYCVKVGTSVEDLYVGKISVNDGQGVDINLSGISIGTPYSAVKKFAESSAVSTSEHTDTKGRICVRYHFVDDGKINLVEGGKEAIEFVIDPETETVYQIIIEFYPVV